MKSLNYFISITLMFLVTTFSFAQEKLITGTVSDEFGLLPSVTVNIEGTTKGTETNANGEFNIKAKKGDVLTFSFAGFETVKKIITDQTRIDIFMFEDSNFIKKELIVTASGLIDLAEGRRTPIAVNTLKEKYIAARASNFDLPRLLKYTPSTQTMHGGGYGDGQLFVRGFNQINTAFLLNGQVINGMEDGRMYWSNWSGLLDIANVIQIQRGLGSSKLAISSVGGTVNIITKTVDVKKGGFVKGLVANDSYYKTQIYYSTGLLENGLAFSAMLGNWKGDGYIDGTPGEGQTYFLSLGYRPVERHTLNFIIMGAPQWHGIGFNQFLHNSTNNKKYNKSWGYKDGKVYPGGRTYYHKPLLNFSWDWKISDKTSLSASAYASFGRGGFATGQGFAFSDSNFSNDYKDENGLIDYDKIKQDNIEKGLSNFIKAKVNVHNWYGFLASVENSIGENITLDFGIDSRIYQGFQYSKATDLLGTKINVTDSKYSDDYTIDKDYGYNPWSNEFTNVPIDQKYDYNYEESIKYVGAFGQLEYAIDRFSVFVQGAISEQFNSKTDLWNYESGSNESGNINNFGFDVKGGASFKINDDNTIFVNGGYYSRQPYLDDIFTAIKRSNDLNSFRDKNQEITSVEFGYKYTGKLIKINLNAYSTLWENRIISNTSEDEEAGIGEFLYQATGVSQLHQGVELDFSTKIDRLRFGGFFSIGDWRYNKNAEISRLDKKKYDPIINESNIPLIIKDIKVSDAAQLTSGLSVSYNFFNNFSIDADYKYNTEMYSQIDIESKKIREGVKIVNEKLPAYGTLDVGSSLSLDINDYQKILFRLNVNNVLDELYIESAGKKTRSSSNDVNWKGLNYNSPVRMGYGRTWNFGVTYKF